MKLFLVKRTDEGGYDTFDSFVCAAKNEAEARATHPYGSDYKWNGEAWSRVYPSPNDYARTDDTWTAPANITVEHIGTAKKDITSVICASFNAG